MVADEAADLIWKKAQKKEALKEDCSTCCMESTEHLKFLSKFPLLERLTIRQECRPEWDQYESSDDETHYLLRHNGVCKCRLRHTLEFAAGLTKLKQLELLNVNINSIFQLYLEAEDFIPNELVTELTLRLCGNDIGVKEHEFIEVLKRISRFFPKLMKLHVVGECKFNELNQASYEEIDMLQMLKELKITTRYDFDDRLKDHLTQTFPKCNFEINKYNEDYGWNKCQPGEDFLKENLINNIVNYYDSEDDMRHDYSIGAYDLF